MADEPQDGSGSGIYNEWLHQWAVNVSAAYQAPSSEDGCTPIMDVAYTDGHLEVAPVKSCGPASDQAFLDAIHTGRHGPTLTSWQGRRIIVRFTDTGRRG